MTLAIPWKIVKVRQTCEAAPEQWNAWDEAGNQFYIRFRHGRLRINQGNAEGPVLWLSDHKDEMIGWDGVLAITGIEEAPDCVHESFVEQDLGW